ncbi:protein mono-ADP-ribosyltransferase PARP14-like isoform X2 [Anabas testudineus]|uniref:Poly [ADP-ribose] polymerase n=1 Tax=Anabas testudineus TaxID=64144 RepID=A0A3Q1I7E7_ANATE|nr:protein mono-ADP-ribosyltransferase PARP14-like isoform X2 [Anabas testudineus]
MSGSECPPVVVEGDWSPAQTKTVKNKLLLHFQSKKKSNGGDCRVEVEDGAPRAAVYFRAPEVRAQVLEKDDHEIFLDGKTIRLRLVSASSPTNNSSNISDSSTDLNKTQTPKSEVEPQNGAAAAKKEDSESSQSVAVVLENVTDNMSREILSILVENISGLDDNSFSLEIIWESDSAVVTFNNPADVERFITVSQTNKNMMKYGLTARLLEEAKRIRVEDLPPTASKDLLEIYFDKYLLDKIDMIPEEQAAIVTFSDPKGFSSVKSICMKDHRIGSIPVKVYPYYESLGTALYGKERPIWKMPEPFTENIDHAVWKYLLMKKELKSINDQMRPFFCCVELCVNNPQVKLSPLLSLLRQKDLTAKDIDNWMSSAKSAFHQQMSQYSAFECPINTPSWKAAETDVRSFIKEDAVLVLDASRGALVVAGRADDIKRIRAPVENIILKAMSQIERQTNGVSDEMDLSPVLFFILTHDGLQKVTQDISPEINVSYSDSSQKLTITGLPAEVFQIKSWILERKVRMSKNQLNAPSCILEFLKSLDPMDMSQDLFTSQGISAFYSIESNRVYLTGSSDTSLADAESKLKSVLSVQTLDVEDQEVLKLHDWVDLNKQLLDTYNSSKKKTVAIQVHPERDKVSVVGFVNPVKEVSSSLKEVMVNYSRVQESLRVKSCAVVQFLNKNKLNDWKHVAKANDVKVSFDSERPKITISGARIHVQKIKSCFQELISSLCTDTFTVDKPGAKKYFMSQGSMFLSTIMTEFSCVVVMRSDNQEEEEEDESYVAENGQCFCKVKTTTGVLVSVTKADICSFSADAVVNAANEDLQHIGGLALALLKAAGPQLQKMSDDYIAKNGRLRPGDAIVTDAGNLPCKCVVHTVGPRFSDFDRRTAVSRLKVAVKESLRQAERSSCSSIALPAISSGVFGFPVDLCAETIAEAVREFCDDPQSRGMLTEIHLVDNNDNTVKVLASAVNNEFSDLGFTMMEPPQTGSKGAEASGGYEPGRGRGQNHSYSSQEEGRAEGGRGRGRGRGTGKKGFQEGQTSNRGDQRSWGHTGPEAAEGSGRMEQNTAEGVKIVLWKGNIQDQTTNVIVNTIGDNMNLTQGAVSKALLQAAGPKLQSAVRSEAKAPVLQCCDVVITKGFKLSCQKVFHTVCPFWDKGKGNAENGLIHIIRYCLDQAEKLKMTSLSFPAIGTGNLGFPRDLVSKVLLREIHIFSRNRNPRYLREVDIVVHPSDSQTIDSFSREFKGHNAVRSIQQEAQDFTVSTIQQSPRKSQQPSVGAVSSPSLGVYQMQIGPITLEVSSGDITKEASDVIVNSSNPDFTLKAGVSKAILDSAGLTVELECAQIVNSPGYQPRPMITTSAGQLPSKTIIHVVGQKDPAIIKDMVYSVLNVCEENTFGSVSFPALGTGQGGAHPSAVADAMVGAVVDFVKKKQPKSVCSVKILIFQTGMMTEFHKNMQSRQGEDLEEKTIITKIKDGWTSFTSMLGFGGEQSSTPELVLEKEEFERAVFQLCAENDQDVRQAKKRITDLIVAEQATRTMRDPFIKQLSQADMEQLKQLQRELTVTIHLDKGLGGQEPSIHLEGLTRDVFTAESAIRDIIRKVERSENLKSKALLVSGVVQWQYPHSDGTMVPFDIYTNLRLEEALGKRQSVKIEINNKTYVANTMLRKAVLEYGRKEVELLRKDLKDDSASPSALPSHWDDMKGDLLKRFPVASGSQEYNNVEKEFRRTGLNSNIISIERVQNVTLWQSYQLMKKEMEKKNKHKNNEKLLFHGTNSNAIDLIDKQGFNRGYAGTHAAAYGNGSYFAVDPIYSARGYAKPDTNGHKPIYLSRVLVGDFTQGKSGMITPPSKNTGNAADLYDSVTDNPTKPTMFIVFNDIQAYPEYLITFT